MAHMKFFAVKFLFANGIVPMGTGPCTWRCIEGPSEEYAFRAVRSEYKNAELLCIYPLESVSNFVGVFELFGLKEDTMIEGYDKYTPYDANESMWNF